MNLPKKVKDIEVIGGSIRIPKVKEILASFFKLPISTHINGDSGPSLGVALIAANYTEGMRTK